MADAPVCLNGYECSMFPGKWFHISGIVLHGSFMHHGILIPYVKSLKKRPAESEKPVTRAHGQQSLSIIAGRGAAGPIPFHAS